jgi:hypothetical protein
VQRLCALRVRIEANDLLGCLEPQAHPSVEYPVPTFADFACFALSGSNLILGMLSD